MENSVALITGAGRGIGFQVAAQLLEKGYKVIAVCQGKESENSLRTFFSKYLNENKILISRKDLRQETDILRLREEISKYTLKLDVIVNCAGVMDSNSGLIESQTTFDWDNTLSINLRAPFIIIREMIPFLKKATKPVIINVTGGLGTFSSKMEGGTHIAYRVSKASINALTLAASEDLKNYNISVISVNPGWVKTDLGGEDAPKDPKVAADEIIKAIDYPGSGILLKEGNIENW